MLKLIQRQVARYYTSSGARSYDWAGQQVAALRPDALLDVGCGDGSRLFNYLQHKPRLFCGIESYEPLAHKARAAGIDVREADLNGPWPFEDGQFDVIHSSQVIEHLHNTRMFLAEALRVLKPGGRFFFTSENLTSLLNLTAVALGYTPFSLQQCCGFYLGNPLGLHHGDTHGGAGDGTEANIGHPAFSGMAGHVRVLGALQARQMMERIGFTDCSVSSIGLMPLPVWLGIHLERWATRRGHWLLATGSKPAEIHP